MALGPIFCRCALQANKLSRILPRPTNQRFPMTEMRNICLFVFSSRSLKTREKYIIFARLALLSLYIFLNDKIHNYVKNNMIVNFIIQRLKSKHTSLKKYTNCAKLIYFLSHFEGTRGEKTKYFAPKT